MEVRELAALIQHVKVLGVKADDMLVFRSEFLLTNRQIAEAQVRLEQLLPGKKIIFLHDAADIKVVCRADLN